MIRETPLFTAARNYGSPVKKMEFLIANGADVNAKNDMGNTPLHCAIIAENYKVNIIKTLVRHGANINARNIYGESPLHIVAKNPHKKIRDILRVRDLVRGKKMTNLLKSPPQHLRDEFHSPSMIVKELLDNGADPNLTNCFGKSALHLALENEDADVDVVIELIKNEANTKAIMPIDGYTPLHLAVNNINSKLSIVEAILATNIEIDALDKKSNTPLHLAVGNYNANNDIIRKLLTLGANINAKNDNSNTPLLIAAEKQPQVIKELLKWSPQINVTNKEGDSALTFASHYCINYPRMVKYLLKAGADVNCINSHHYTPLQLAVENYNIIADAATEVLISVVGDMESILDSGRFCLDREMRHTDSIKKRYDRLRNLSPSSIEENRRSKLLIIEYLLVHGAEVNAKTVQVFSPLDIAIKKLENQRDNGLCTKLLLKYAVLKNFENNAYQRIVDLSGYKNFDCYKELMLYLKSCIAEVKHMKRDKIINSLSLYEYLTNGNQSTVRKYSESAKEDSGSKEDESRTVEALFKTILQNKYPIYREILAKKIKKSTYVSKMMNHCIHCFTDDKEQEGRRKISLDPDTTLSVMKYLKRSDLLNLTLAFWYNGGDDNFSEPPKRSETLKRTRNASSLPGPEVAKIAKFGMKSADLMH